MKLGTCRSCGASIYWCRTPNGKAMPLDPEPTKRVVVIVRAPGPDLPDEEVAKVMDTYQAHWASCPQADEWRKKKAEAKANG